MPLEVCDITSRWCSCGEAKQPLQTLDSLWVLEISNTVWGKQLFSYRLGAAACLLSSAEQPVGSTSAAYNNPVFADRSSNQRFGFIYKAIMLHFTWHLISKISNAAWQGSAFTRWFCRILCTAFWNCVCVCSKFHRCSAGHCSVYHVIWVCFNFQSHIIYILHLGKLSFVHTLYVNQSTVQRAKCHRSDVDKASHMSNVYSEAKSRKKYNEEFSNMRQFWRQTVDR